MLTEWRKKNGVTQAELGRRVDVSRISIWRIENGEQRPSPELAKRIEAETGIPAASLIFPDQRAA